MTWGDAEGRASVEGHWYEEEGRVLHRLAHRDATIADVNAMMLLYSCASCLVQRCRVVGYVRKKSFAAAVPRNQVGPPGSCTKTERGMKCMWPRYSPPHCMGMVCEVV